MKGFEGIELSCPITFGHGQGSCEIVRRLMKVSQIIAGLTIRMDLSLTQRKSTNFYIVHSKELHSLESCSASR